MEISERGTGEQHTEFCRTKEGDTEQSLEQYLSNIGQGVSQIVQINDDDENIVNFLDCLQTYLEHFDNYKQYEDLIDSIKNIGDFRRVLGKIVNERLNGFTWDEQEKVLYVDRNDPDIKEYAYLVSHLNYIDCKLIEDIEGKISKKVVEYLWNVVGSISSSYGQSGYFNQFLENLQWEFEEEQDNIEHECDDDEKEEVLRVHIEKHERSIKLAKIEDEIQWNPNLKIKKTGLTKFEKEVIDLCNKILDYDLQEAQNLITVTDYFCNTYYTENADEETLQLLKTGDSSIPITDYLRGHYIISYGDYETELSEEEENFSYGYFNNRNITSYYCTHVDQYANENQWLCGLTSKHIVTKDSCKPSDISLWKRLHDFNRAFSDLNEKLYNYDRIP